MHNSFSNLRTSIIDHNLEIDNSTKKEKLWCIIDFNISDIYTLKFNVHKFIISKPKNVELIQYICQKTLGNV